MISADRPSPSLCLVASSSTPDTLALARFIGLPMAPSSHGGCIYEVLGSSEGGPESSTDAVGGVDPAVGVLDAGDLRVAAELASKGSAECCRFNCNFNQNLMMLAEQ